MTDRLTTLQKSKFRSRFKLPDNDFQYIQDKCVETIRSHAVDLISTRLAPASPKDDGKQTPRKGHPVFIAQHAIATYCRGCRWKWHRAKKGRVLSENEIGFVVELVIGVD
jgi:exodeoxyribonuclease V alpha subunit